jgi:hypothetical protein
MVGRWKEGDLFCYYKTFTITIILLPLLQNLLNMDMEQMPPYGSGTIKVKCQQCGKDAITIVGKRERKYCSDSCRQKAYKISNKVEMITISKVEYDRLLSAEAVLKPERILSDNNDGYIVSGNSIKEIEADVQRTVIAKENNKPFRLPGESSIEYRIRGREE